MTQSEQSNPPKKPPEEEERLLRKVYFDILGGWSYAAVEEEEVCIKHFDLKTQTIVDTYYAKVYKKARENGLLNEQELLARLEEDGTWSKEEEATLKKREKAIEGLKGTSTKALNTKMQEKIVESNPHAFFDKKIHELTFFQVNLLNYAKLFSSILKNLDPPDRIKNNATRLLEFAKSEQKKREQENRKRKAEDSKPGRSRR